MTEGESDQLFNRCYRYFYLIYHLNQDPNLLTTNVATFTYTYTIIQKKYLCCFSIAIMFL